MKVLRNWQSYKLRKLVEEEINLREFLNGEGHVGIYIPRQGHFLPGALDYDFRLAVVAYGHFGRDPKHFDPTRGIQLSWDRPSSSLIIDLKNGTLTPSQRFLVGDSDKIHMSDRFFYWGNIQELIREFGKEGFKIVAPKVHRFID